MDLEIVPGRFIGKTHPCFFIAEIGQNHQGDMATAKNLIAKAKKCGADCVKFQKSCLSERFTESALNRPYASHHSWGQTYGKHKEYLEFSDEEFVDLQHFAEHVVKIPFTASPMDYVSLRFLDKIDVPFIKIGSGEVDNFPFLKEAALTKKPLVISTGMRCMDSVCQTYATVKDIHDRFVLLHCVSAYPPEVDQINLQVINQFIKEFPDINIGYSGHELGTSISVAAAVMGAKVIERHITMDKSQKGTDHKCSLEPDEFSKMVSDIRLIERAIGSAIKEVQPCEGDTLQKFYKSIVASRTLPNGTVISKQDIKIKIHSERKLGGDCYNQILGKVVVKQIEKDEPLTYESIQ